jgi:hypothetical protein
VIRRPLSRLARHALVEHQRQFQAILDMAAEADGVRAEDGWQYDAQRGEWVNPTPPAVPAAPSYTPCPKCGQWCFCKGTDTTSPSEGAVAPEHADG